MEYQVKRCGTKINFFDKVPDATFFLTYRLLTLAKLHIKVYKMRKLAYFFGKRTSFVLEIKPEKK